MTSSFYAGPTDLAHAHAVIDDFDAHLRSDDLLASWAHATVIEPVSERALGAFAEWATEVVEPAS